MNKMKSACCALLLVVSVTYSNNEVVKPQSMTEKEVQDYINTSCEQIREQYKDRVPKHVLNRQILLTKYALYEKQERYYTTEELYAAASRMTEKLAQRMEQISKELDKAAESIQKQIDPLNIGEKAVVTPQVHKELNK